MGSMPPEMPSMVDRVPVGAMVSSWEFLSPYCLTSFLVSSEAFSWKYGDLMMFSMLQAGNAPDSLAMSADSFIAVSAMIFPILLHRSMDSFEPYWTSILMSMSARPMIPRPICLHLVTESLCSCRGWRGSPSSRTSLSPRMQMRTACLNSSSSNFLSLTKAERFIEPSRQLPPAGRGSSAQGLVPA